MSSAAPRRARPARIAALLLVAFCALLASSAPATTFAVATDVDAAAATETETAAAAEPAAAAAVAPKRAKVNVPDYTTYSMDDIKALTFYELLGLEPTADTKTIKRNFRTISLRQHPDKATTEEDKKRRELFYPRFVLASDTLSDERKRLNYDHLLEIGKRPAKITDSDIDNAWDEKNQRWASDGFYGFLSEMQALAIVVATTAAGLLYPIYNHYKKGQEKAAKEKAAKAASLAKLQALAAKGRAQYEAEESKKKAAAEAKGSKKA